MVNESYCGSPYLVYFSRHGNLAWEQNATFIKQVMKRGFVKNAARRTKAVPSTVSGRRAAPKRRPEGRFKGESEASLRASCMGAHCQLSFKKKSFLMENN